MTQLPDKFVLRDKTVVIAGCSRGIGVEVRSAENCPFSLLVYIVDCTVVQPGCKSVCAASVNIPCGLACVTAHASSPLVQFIKQFLQRGNRVIAGVRTPDKAQALQDLRAHHEQQLKVIQLDVQDMDSIAAWGHNIAERIERADVRNIELPCSLTLRCMRGMI